MNEIGAIAVGVRLEEVRGADPARRLRLRAIDDADVRDDHEALDGHRKREGAGGIGSGEVPPDAAVAGRRFAARHQRLAVVHTRFGREARPAERHDVAVFELGARRDRQPARVAVRSMVDDGAGVVRMHTELPGLGRDGERDRATPEALGRCDPAGDVPGLADGKCVARCSASRQARTRWCRRRRSAAARRAGRSSSSAAPRARQRRRRPRSRRCSSPDPSMVNG